MDRRQFLKTLTAAAAPLVVPSTMLSGGDRAPPSQRVAIGIIGAGAMGSAHARAFSTMPGAHVRAVCDVDAAHRRTAAAIVNAAYRNADCDQTADLTALLARTDIDAVVIALPDHWHMTAAILAARAGKAVYCEKPLAWSIGQGRRVVRAADKGEIVFQCGTQQRSAFRFRRACELVRNGRIGRVHTVQVGLPAGDVWAGDATAGAPQAVPAGLDWQKWLGPAPARPYRRDCCHVNWRYVSDFGGGPVTDWGAHHIDIVHWAMNCDRSGPSRIEPLAAAFPRAGPWDTPLTFHVRCRYGRRCATNRR